MTDFDKTNRGSIWKNDKKEKDTHPDFTGSLNVGGVEYWVSAWKRKDGANPKSPALSFSVKPKDAEQPSAKRTAKPLGKVNIMPNDDMDGDRIPILMNAAVNLPWSEQFRIVAKQWVDADAAASILEELKSANLSRLMMAQGDMPVSRAEMNVKASAEWGDFIQKMVAQRGAANKLKVQMEYLRMKFQEWASENATKRAEMRL